MGIYSITKAALLAMVKVLESELASKGVQVNPIIPRGFDTDMSKEVCDNLISFADEKEFTALPFRHQMEHIDPVAGNRSSQCQLSVIF